MLRELEKKAPGVPFLALGQTVFWDEPMKAGVALALRRLGSKRKFVAGVHDSDYFAKYKHATNQSGIHAFPHNDTSTKDMWSAAGEFSALFGSETVVTRQKMLLAGAKLGKVAHGRPEALDELTEAWGWRGLASTDDSTETIANMPLGKTFRPLFDTLNWAVENSLKQIGGTVAQDARQNADRLRSFSCDTTDAPGSESLAGFYENLLPQMYSFAAGEPVEIETTRTTELLKFNRATAARPRFELVQLFLDPDFRLKATKAYTQATRHGGMYALDRFGVGALPFDVMVPDHGRGTLRLGNAGGVIMTPKPLGFRYKKRPESITELAELLEERFGPECALIGKAVSLIGMLAREFIFVFHEGASSYVRQSRKMHQLMGEAGHKLELHPILRIKYLPWEAMGECAAEFELPEPLQTPFGREQVSAKEFASEWKQVGARERKRLNALAKLNRPMELLEYLAENFKNDWRKKASEYRRIHDAFQKMSSDLDSLKEEKARLLEQIAELKEDRLKFEKAKGEHWRTHLFEKKGTDTAWRVREELTEKINSVIEKVDAVKRQYRELSQRQSEIVDSEEVRQMRVKRSEIALEAEVMRLRLVRDAVTATEGLEHAGHRPCAWWFPLVCPENLWFKNTVESAEHYLEPLV
ncbi:MAG: hypothetical protein ACOCX1_02760 [Fimbriimonadaceae bacterium]